MVKLALFVVTAGALYIAWTAAKEHSLAMYHVIGFGASAFLLGAVKK